MYENKKRNLSIYRYLSDMVITIVMLVMLVFIITTLTYKETISVKYLNYVMTASVLFGSYASAVVMKKVYGEEAVKYALVTAVVLGIVIILYGISEQGSGNLRTAIINSLILAIGKIIPNVIKPAQKKKKKHK